MHMKIAFVWEILAKISGGERVKMTHLGCLHRPKDLVFPGLTNSDGTLHEIATDRETLTCE